MLPQVERIRIRCLELTWNLASTTTPQLLTASAKTVTSLLLMNFGYDEHAADIDRIMIFLGRNIVAFSSKVTNRSLVYVTSEYCNQLKTLRLNRFVVPIEYLYRWHRKVNKCIMVKHYGI